MAKNIILWLGVFVAAIALLLGIGYLQNKGEQPEVHKEVSSIRENDWVRGDRASKVVLVEYGDFQCPACRDYEPWVAQVTKELGSQFALVFRHFPLQMHKNARTAAMAAEAAGAQGKFWEMHDLLYANQKAWEEHDNAQDIFMEYARSLQLNTDTFKQAMENPALKLRIDGDYNEGVGYGVRGTPTFFLNGTKIEARTYDALKSAVQQSIDATK